MAEGPVVAVMQPYFIPYAGYYRLFQAADIFIYFDDVQFPRRGYVHRNQLENRSGELEWLTMPLRKARREVKINQLELVHEPAKVLADRVGRFPALDSPNMKPVREVILGASGNFVDMLYELDKVILSRLEIDCRLYRSSDLGVDPRVKGEERIIELVRSVNGKIYVNSPGGVDLYNPVRFAANHINLVFLQSYQGRGVSVVQELVSGTDYEVRKNIIDQSGISNPPK